MKMFLAVLAFIFMPSACYADKAIPEYDDIPTIEAGDLSLFWDVSDTSAEYPLGKLKKTTGAKLLEWIETNISGGAFPATAGSALYLMRVNAAGDGFEVVNTFSGEVGNMTPNMAVYSDVSGELQPHPVVSGTELSMLDGVRENIQQQIDDFTDGGGASMAITTVPESDNKIVSTIAVSPVANYRIKTWLSNTDGGAPAATSFDGDGGAPWTDLSSTVFSTTTANIQKELLTGGDGTASITFADSGVATKYLCADATGRVTCAEIAFTGAATCGVVESLTQDGAVDIGTAVLSTGNLAQKIDGATIPEGTWEICELKILTTKQPTGTCAVHFEVWSEGTANAGKLKGATTKIGGSSGTVTVSQADPTIQTFTWASNPPIVTGGTNYFLHFVNETTPNINTYWQGNYNETLYSTTDFDLWKDGVDMSVDAYFIISLKPVS